MLARPIPRCSTRSCMDVASYPLRQNRSSAARRATSGSNSLVLATTRTLVDIRTNGQEQPPVRRPTSLTPVTVELVLLSRVSHRGREITGARLHGLLALQPVRRST